MKATTYTYKTNGDLEVKQYDEMISLGDLQEAVGGHLETVPFWNEHRGVKCVAFCNEEGKIHNLPVNERADALWKAERSRRTSDILVGNVIVICGDDEFMRAL